ncbi:MAG TPA: YdeI/OmpD-associated family protein [Chitinophagales bacterium]|nr:YdeI/OmpD-associated family protein [Chitinophagales bacterium]
MKLKGGITTHYAKTRKEWRKWLEKNHAAEKSVWLIIYHKESKTPSVYYNEAVEEALCFGWIDSKANKRDAESFYLFFAQRKLKSNWSKANRDRVEKLIAQGQMTKTGQAMIDLAKKTGTWTALEGVQNSVIPTDLQKLFSKNKKAFTHFNAFPPSSKRIILEWILNAKRPETRQKRIQETVELAEKNIRANHYRQ